MRYMKWSWTDLQSCPAAYVAVIARIAQREAQEAKARQNAAKAKRGR